MNIRLQDNTPDTPVVPAEEPTPEVAPIVAPEVPMETPPAEETPAEGGDPTVA